MDLEQSGQLFDGSPDGLALPRADRKKRVRRAALQIREHLDAAYRHAATADLAQQLRALIRTRGVRRLAVYLPWRGEPDLQALWAELAADSVQLALPVVTARASAMQFRCWQPGEPLQADVHGLPVPADDQPECDCDAMVIPCIAARHDGYRLGSGGGYYDRTLAGLLAPAGHDPAGHTSAWPHQAHAPASQTRPPWTVGVVFSRCLSQTAWFDEHDIRMDCIVADRVR